MARASGQWGRKADHHFYTHDAEIQWRRLGRPRGSRRKSRVAPGHRRKHVLPNRPSCEHGKIAFPCHVPRRTHARPDRRSAILEPSNWSLMILWRRTGSKGDISPSLKTRRQCTSRRVGIHFSWSLYIKPRSTLGWARLSFHLRLALDWLCSTFHPGREELVWRWGTLSRKSPRFQQY